MTKILLRLVIVCLALVSFSASQAQESSVAPHSSDDDFVILAAEMGPAPKLSAPDVDGLKSSAVIGAPLADFIEAYGEPVSTLHLGKGGPDMCVFIAHGLIINVTFDSVGRAANINLSSDTSTAGDIATVVPQILRKFKGDSEWQKFAEQPGKIIWTRLDRAMTASFNQGAGVLVIQTRSFYERRMNENLGASLDVP